MSHSAWLSWTQNMKLRSRIFIWFFGLLLTVQAVTAWFVYRYSLDNVEQNIHERLVNGQSLFIKEFENRGQYQQNSAITIAKDWGLRQAMGQQDGDTLRSALNNHRSRVDADLGIAIHSTGQLLATTLSGNPAAQEQIQQHLNQSSLSDDTTQEKFIMVGAQLYQLIITPVKAPLTIGWVAIGFAIDDALAKHFHTVTNLDVSFVHVAANARLSEGKVVGASLERAPDLESTNLESLTQTPNYQRNYSDTIQLGAKLNHDDKGHLVAVMQKSVTEFLDQFRRWWINLLLLYAGALLAAGLVAAMIARSVTQPVSSLLDLTRRITSGNFSRTDNISELHLGRKDEIGALAREFQTMERAVTVREDEIRYRAEHDALTGLFNREMFLKLLQQTIESRATNESQGDGVLAVVLFNINRFKDINDTLGHHNGDQLLQQLSQRLSQKFPGQHIARLGADQFGVFVTLECYNGIHACCDDIRDCFATPFRHNSIDMLMSVTQGVATYPEHGQDALTLLRLADVAMFTAKAQRQEEAIYDSKLDHHSVQRLSLMSDLPSAIEQNQLELYFQPTLHIQAENTYKLAKVECLVRWIHPIYGFIPPDDFIHLAEQSGTIIQLTQWVLRSALSQCHEWRKQGMEIGVAVNISASDLFRGSLLNDVPQLLQEFDVAPQLLTIEVTESEVMEDPERAVSILKKLKSLGIRLSVDDYGTGYSSLAHLKQLPVQELKIDKSFVLNLRHDQDDQAIVRSTIDLGHIMGLVVVAEGVEDIDSLEYLASHGCDYAQGYHISKPLSKSDINTWLSSNQNLIQSH